MKRRGFIGDAHLKQFVRGSLAVNTPITQREMQIFLLFVKGTTLERIHTALEHDHINIDGQRLFDIVRKVGLSVQSFYRSTVNQPSDIPKLIFADFVRGEAVPALCEKNGMSPFNLFAILRSVGLLYATYKNQE